MNSKLASSPEFSRNYGFWTETEQNAIMNARVAIAGVGGDGFQLGLKLAQMGVQTFDIADPEVFEPENTNRVPGATVSTYGRNKAEVFKERVLDINPQADIRVFNEGVTEDNAKEFIRRATIVFDESELTHLEIGTVVARNARERGIPDILAMNIGFAALITSFDPNSKWTFERYMGIPKDMPLDEVKELSVSFSHCLPYLPKYGDLKTLEAVQKGAPLPSVAPGIDVSSAIATSQAFLHIVGPSNNRRQPIWAPKVGYMDAYTLESGVTQFPRISHYAHLGQAIFRNLVGKYSKASYTDEERQLRLAEQEQLSSL